MKAFFTTTADSYEMNHALYQRMIRHLDERSLRYVIRDCREAIAAYPDNPKAGYYQDEIHYCAMELRRREEGKK